jgi:hypothetical protein
MSYKYNTLYNNDLQIEYAQPHPNFNFVIHLNSVAVQLGFISEEMTSILQEQQEWMATMSYEPEQQYKHPPARPAQPQLLPKIIVHPNSVAAQLKLTQEEIMEVLEDQERWMREEYIVEE